MAHQPAKSRLRAAPTSCSLLTPHLDFQAHGLAVAQHIQRGHLARELLGGEVGEGNALAGQEGHRAVCRIIDSDENIVAM